MYWVGVQPGDRHWNISSPGWAKHAYSSFFAPWNEATVFIFNYARFEAKAVLAALERYKVDTLCAPRTVAHAVQEPLDAYHVVRVKPFRRRAAQPRSHRAGTARVGLATRDGDGYLTFVGRGDDVFKACDYRLSPFELESVLIEFVAVAEAAVVPSPDRCDTLFRRRS